MSKNTFTSTDFKHIAELAKLKVSPGEEVVFIPQLIAILHFVSKLQKLPTKGVSPVSQVTGLENVFREDKIDETRMLTQEEALANAPSVYKGFFKVKAVFEES